MYKSGYSFTQNTMKNTIDLYLYLLTTSRDLNPGPV